MTQLPEGWQQDHEFTVSTRPADRAWGSVTMYVPPSHIAGQLCWQAHRNNATLSGIVATQTEGVLAVDQALALPDAEFIRQAAQKIILRISDLQAELVEIGCGDEVNGYALGYAMGRTEAFDRLHQLLESAAQLPEAA